MMEQTDQVTHQPATDALALAQLTAAAAALIERALLESLGPVEALGEALARLTAAAPAAALQTRADLAVCIQSLQFHDRLAQHLIEVRDLLAQTSLMAAPPTGGAGRTALREHMRAQFADDCGALDSTASRPVNGRSCRRRAEEGSVELF